MTRTADPKWPKEYSITQNVILCVKWRELAGGHWSPLGDRWWAILQHITCHSWVLFLFLLSIIITRKTTIAKIVVGNIIVLISVVLLLLLVLYFISFPLLSCSFSTHEVYLLFPIFLPAPGREGWNEQVAVWHFTFTAPIQSNSIAMSWDKKSDRQYDLGFCSCAFIAEQIIFAWSIWSMIKENTRKLCFLMLSIKVS